MSFERRIAIQYLRAPGQKAWEWADNGSVILWHDGTTIAFKQEIQEILARFQDKGLPPLGAIVMLLAACRGKIPNPTMEFPEHIHNEALNAALHPGLTENHAAQKSVGARFDVDLNRLRQIGKLPEEFRSGLKARAALAEIIFENLPQAVRTPAESVLEGMKSPISDVDLKGIDPENSGLKVLQHISWISQGVGEQDAESLTIRIQSGLDELPKAAELEIPPALQIRNLLEEMQNTGTSLEMIACTTQELLAAIRLPRRLARPDPLALGGVADITNRGPLDRLLLSELAQDDLTLAVRVALNEALYLKREPPKKEPGTKLTLLLDSGLRLWGIPRILATSVALALVASQRDTLEVNCWRTKGKGLAPVDLFSTRGILGHLEALEVHLDSTESLSAFDQILEQRGPLDQSVLITHLDTFNDPQFRQKLDAEGKRIRFAATIDHQGSFALHALPKVSRDPIAQADLDLARILALDAKATRKLARRKEDLPLILDLHPLPFLQPIAGKVECWSLPHDDFWYATMQDRRLVQFRNDGKGAEILCHRLQAGITLWLGGIQDKVIIIKAPTTHRRARMLMLTKHDANIREVEVDLEPTMHSWKTCFETDGVLISVGDREIRALSLNDGRLLDRLRHQGQPQHGRFLTHNSITSCILWNGSQIVLEELRYPAACSNASDRLCTFDRSGMDGPWVLMRSGQVISTVTGESVTIKHPHEFEVNEFTRVSQCGHVIVLKASFSPQGSPGFIHYAYHLVNGEGWKAKVPPGPYQYEPPILPTWNVYRWIERIAFADESIVIFLRSNKWKALHLGSSQTIVWRKNSDLGGVQELVAYAFKPFRIDASWGYTLQVAELDCNARVYLDSRGMRHFKSDNPDLAEVTLLLAEHELAGWSSQGASCGPAFFFKHGTPQDAQTVHEDLMAILRPRP